MKTTLTNHSVTKYGTVVVLREGMQTWINLAQLACECGALDTNLRVSGGISGSVVASAQDDSAEAGAAVSRACP